MKRSHQSRDALVIILIAIAAAIFNSCSSGSDSSYSSSADKTSLYGTKWMIRDLNGKRVLLPEGGGELFLTLTSSGAAVGMSGCNNYTGKATISGTSIKFGPLAGTKKLCEGIMQTEDEYLASLNKVTSYKISGNTLSLMDASKKVVATFTGFKATGLPPEN